MAVTMQYRWILIPAGILGVGTGFVLYARERGRCKQLACRMAGERVTLTLLIVAALVVANSIVLDQFPGVTSELLAKLTKGPESADHSQCQAHAPAAEGGEWVLAIADTITKIQQRASPSSSWSKT
jgi:hypothetical protein